MDVNTKIYIIPYSEWSRNLEQMYELQFMHGNGVVYAISDEELDFPSKTLKELTRELRYNPFESSGPLTEKEKLLLDISNNLDYLVCLADLGVLGGDF